MSSRPAHPFVKFFSAMPGHLVPRYGSAGATKGNDIIGASYRTPSDKAADPVTGEVTPDVTQDLEAIVAITADEWARYSREYSRAVVEGGLKERTEDEYWAAIDADRVAATVATEKAAAAAASKTTDGAGPASSTPIKAEIASSAAGRATSKGRAGGPAQE